MEKKEYIKIISIVENQTFDKKVKAKHGLCLYIETKENKILFDTGPNHLLIENAEKLGVDLSQIDTVVISHGHVDHGGGLKSFFNINKKAKVYIQKQAFEKHYTKIIGIPFYVGLDKSLQNHKKIKLTDGDVKINDTLQLISVVEEQTFQMQSNKALYKREAGKIVQDDFDHEQSLILTLGRKTVLISGCSHRGIIDIQDIAEKTVGKKMDYVVGGFHIFNPFTKKYENTEVIKKLGEMLKFKGSKYFTCHCTGMKGFHDLKEVLQDDIEYLSAGKTIVL